MPSCTLCESPACTFSKIQHFSAVAQEKASQTKTRTTANSKAKFSENFPLWEVFLFCGSLPGLGDLNVCQRMKAALRRSDGEKPTCTLTSLRHSFCRVAAGPKPGEGARYHRRCIITASRSPPVRRCPHYG